MASPRSYLRADYPTAQKCGMLEKALRSEHLVVGDTAPRAVLLGMTNLDTETGQDTPVNAQCVLEPTQKLYTVYFIIQWRRTSVLWLCTVISYQNSGRSR